MSVKILVGDVSEENGAEFAHIDLFSGIGGFALGFQKAGLNIVEHFFSEIDKNAINIYKKHFPKAKELGDVTTIRDFSELRRSCAGKIVIITFGFPCQDLSVAGKGAGLAGARSGLFFEAIRIVREIQPQYFIFENVKGLLTNNRGADFVRCLREVADIGLYDCEWQLVNTSWFLPQNRERVYFVGHLRGKSTPKIFPIQESNKKANGVQGQCANTLTCEQYTKLRQGTFIAESKQLQKIGKDGRIIKQNGKAAALIRKRSEELKKIRRENKKKYGKDSTPFGKREIAARTDGIMNTITTVQSVEQYLFDNHKIRKLTPLECERLQGFPGGWTGYGAAGKKISDSARYKALGNAVSVPIPEFIGKRLRKLSN